MFDSAGADPRAARHPLRTHRPPPWSATNEVAADRGRGVERVCRLVAMLAPETKGETEDREIRVIDESMVTVRGLR